MSDPVATEAPLGTVVTLSDLAEPPVGIQGDGAYDRLLATFAISTRVQAVEITYGGRRLDVADALVGEQDIDVQVGDEHATLTLLEWNRRIKPDGQLHLCDADGISLFALPAQADSHQIPFAAYLRWTRMPQHAAQLPAAGLDQGLLGDLVREARKQLQAALDKRQDQRRREVIEGWKRGGFYPFEGEPATEAERVTRETFDLVAIEAASVIDASRPPAKRLSLRLLKEALAHSPGQIHRVLEQVLDLEPEDVARLDRLLSHTPLSRVISASTAIAERLEFLGALVDLTTDKVHRKRLLERSQLHKLLEVEPWIFGEEYALAMSDRGLTEVLRQYLSLLGRSALSAEISEEVLDMEGQRAIVDLLLARRVVNADDQKTMLIIELKRPSVSIGDTELAQLRKYAMAVVKEPRFDLSRTRFEFWAISTKVSESVEHERRNRNQPLGLVKEYDDVPVRLWVKTWAEVLHTAEHRLKYVQSELEYEPTQEQAFDYLRRVYADRLPPTVAHGQAA